MTAENGARQRVTLANKVTLDFTGLLTDEKQRSKTPVDAFSEGDAYKTTNQEQKAATSKIESLEREQATGLLIQARKEKEAHQKAREIYKIHQESTKRSSQLQSEILKGVQAGENIHRLFLKAVEALSLATGNGLLFRQIKEDLIAIYGQGLQEKPALAIELEEVQTRLQRLTEAEQKTEDTDSKERIKRAIKAHKIRATEIKQTIEKPLP